ncbi:MAG: hypothetical protein KAG53_10330 [Endozoicomonadaceae bacterium]|nr:hypothetical protein [Endozoicomonadaceae bacterium]
MNNSMISFSAKGACSYVWNKNCANGDSKVVNFFKCLATLIRTVFDKYQVEECAVVTIYNENNKTIFGEEYKRQLNDRKIAVQSNTMDVDINNTVADINKNTVADTNKNTAADTNKNTVADVDENNKHDAASSVNNRSSSSNSKLKIQIISAVDLRKLIDDHDVLPNIHYIVKGDFKITVNDSMTELPDNLTVEGELNLYKCTKLERLPSHLTLGGHLNLYGCESLTAIPEYLNNFEGNLVLVRCVSLISVAKQLKAVGDIDFDGCLNLVIPPEDIWAGGYIDFSKCFRMTYLPKKIYAGGNLVTRLTVPESDNIIVKGKISKK